MDLGQILMQMMGGQPPQAGAMPQMAPPMGIPWEQPQAPAPQAPQPPAPPITQPHVLRQPGPGSMPATPDALLALRSFVQNNLAQDRARWEEQDRTAYEEARSREAVGGGLNVPPETSQPHVLKQPGPGSAPAMPSFSSTPTPQPPLHMAASGLQGYTPPLAVDPATGAPIGNNGVGGVKPDLASLLYGNAGEDIPPMPTKKPQPAGAKALARSGPAETSNSKTPSPSPNQGGGGGARQASANLSGPRSPFQEAPYGESFDPHLGRFMLQAGLNLMVPQWGGPLANIGAAVGEGAEAVGRGDQQTQQTKLNERKIALEEARVAKIGQGGLRRATQSSGSKRLKEKTPAQQFASTLSPEGALFFNQRMKDLNKIDAEAGETADAKMQKIMQETQTVDRRARASRGMARSEEIPDSLLNQVAGTPQEITALSAVAGDPTQRALLAARLEAIKTQKAGKANGG